MRNAGLALLGPEGRTIDRFRDQLMLPARNDQLETVGFIGLRADPAPFSATSPSKQVHRRSNALVGVSRLTAGRWSGIPLCDTLLSAQQARILGRHAAADSVIVALGDGESAAVGLLDELSRFSPGRLGVNRGQ